LTATLPSLRQADFDPAAGNFHAQYADLHAADLHAQAGEAVQVGPGHIVSFERGPIERNTTRSGRPPPGAAS